MTDRTGETVELLQQLIRNACVNVGTPESGQEVRNADALTAFLDGSGVDIERFEPLPGRTSVIARIEGSDPRAPSLMLMGHTDVVPATPERWSRDPFGGELVDGEVWGRGAVDMLNLTASMAVAFRALAREGFRPRGTLSFLGVADEEALGALGAGWLIENAPDAVRTDHVVTENGGYRLPLAGGGPKLPVTVAEKGTYWVRIAVSGESGHGSMPFRRDNAVVSAAEVVRRIAEHRPPARMHEAWVRFVDGLDLHPDLRSVLLDRERVEDALASLPDPALARAIHATTHTTFAPTVVAGGVKTNMIPDSVQLRVDIRTLPGEGPDEVHEMLREALGELYDQVDIAPESDDRASSSPIDGPLWDALQRVATSLAPRTRNVPFMTVGATDARFFRRIGATAYGYGLFSERMDWARFHRMLHGDDERVDVESLRLSTLLWGGLAREFLG